MPKLAKYFKEIEKFLEEPTNVGFIISKELSQDIRSENRCYIKGLIIFSNLSELHFREFISIEPITKKLIKEMYVYHYQDKNRELIFRYDNAIHRPIIAVPNHKHTPQAVSRVYNIPHIKNVILEIIQNILSKNE